MQLPFTREQFFDLFVAYNGALWPVVFALWVASAVIVALRLSASHPHDRWVSALLVGHWAWSAVAYHVAFFTRINRAAWLCVPALRLTVTETSVHTRQPPLVGIHIVLAFR